MAWPDDPCATCPRLAKGLSLPCRAQTTRHRRYCDLADPSHPDFKPAYCRMLADEPEPETVLPAPVQMPGLARQAASFFKAAVNHVSAGAPSATNVQREARLAICRTCEYYRDERCGVCGCFVAVKASWADQSCPLNPPKWGPVVPHPSGSVEG